MTLSKNFALETDLICVSEDEYNEQEPYSMDKYEIMNMLADKKRTSIVHKKADNHYILFLDDKDCYNDRYHFICPLSADKEVQKDWLTIKWILVNLFDSTEKGKRLFY